MGQTHATGAEGVPPRDKKDLMSLRKGAETFSDGFSLLGNARVSDRAGADTVPKPSTQRLEYDVMTRTAASGQCVA